MTGWDHKQYLYEFGMIGKFTPIGDYCSTNTAEDIPELIDNFLGCFLDLETDKFNVNEKDFADLCNNFCNWLFMNEFTNFKLSFINDALIK